MNVKTHDIFLTEERKVKNYENTYLLQTSIHVQQNVNKSKQCYSSITYTRFWNFQKFISALLTHITYNNKGGSNKTAWKRSLNSRTSKLNVFFVI